MKKKSVITLCLLFLFFTLLSAAGKIGYDYYRLSHVDTSTLYQTALTKLWQRESYRFALSSSLKLNNYTAATTKIAGEKDPQDHLHIWGKMLTTPIELYQWGNTSYRYCNTTKSWTKQENHPLTQDPLLRMELLPTTCLANIEGISPTYRGKENKNGKIYHIYSLSVTGENPALSRFFENPVYRIDIEAKTKEITKATIIATAKTNPVNTLTLKIFFHDINGDFRLKAPL